MRAPRRVTSVLLLPFALLTFPHAYVANVTTYREELESSLRLVHAVATGATGALCVTQHFGRLRAPMYTTRWDTARARADLAANILHQLGLETAEVLMAVSQGLVLGNSAPERAVGARALALRSDGVVNSAVAWERYGAAEPVAVVSPQLEKPPDTEYPWYVSAEESETVRSPKFMPSPPGATMEGWWTYPYYSCEAERWLLSYTVPVSTIRGLKGVVSLDIDISNLEVNQCEVDNDEENDNQIYSFHGTHKCPYETTFCEYKPVREISIRYSGWARGSYICRCRPGFYSLHHPDGFNGSLVEVAYQEYKEKRLENWREPYECLQCQPGCETCRGPEPCLATYNWPFRISLLVISVSCAFMTVLLTIYTRHHRRVKVFRVASPVFLSITLLGCAIMYMEMAAIFPVLDRYSCIATKWTRHMGFCITYTALLMKTWRVSLTYRVKSAHKLKLTDKQLLQWMAPILLIMLVYLGTWTLSAPPDAEVITDNRGLKFKQCTYNWWDHSLAIGEILFLLWGVRVCYRVRHAESLYNEARLISIAIYNIFTVNSLMIAFHLLILPRAGPDIKYLLGFIRTQLSTSTTVLLVFLPKVLRVVRGTGDTWDSRARARGVPASSSLNGIGLVPDEPPDLFQENEELKEEVQKLAAQIEFMKIVQMEMHNRHLRPRPGGYFTTNTTVPQSPMHAKTVSISQVLVALSFYATGSYQRLVGATHGTLMSQQSVSRAIKEVTNALNADVIVNKWLKFPQTRRERDHIKQRFYEKFQIPSVVGAIDGTHVAIIRPAQNEERFYNRKGFHSRNVLIICDADMNILSVDSSFGGATHDSFILNQHPVKSYLINLLNSGELVYLLGDSGYPQRNFLMTPILDAPAGSPEEHYTNMHCVARNVVERTVGVLKNRWRCLLGHRVLHYHPDTAARIINACCVLHNICNKASWSQNDSEDIIPASVEEDSTQEISSQDLPELTRGNEARFRLVRELWAARRY